jgi:transcriptional regulator with XRE-family HTH domain
MRQLPLKHVAHDLKVSVSVISQWERGHRFPSLRNLESIAEYLGVPTCYLICANDDACPYKQDW